MHENYDSMLLLLFVVNFIFFFISRLVFHFLFAWVGNSITTIHRFRGVVWHSWKRKITQQHLLTTQMHQVITHIIKIAFSLKIICCLLKLGFCFVTPTYRRGSRHRHRHRHCQCLQIRLSIKKQLWNQSYLLSDWFFERFMFVIMFFNFLLLISYTGALVKSIQIKRRGNREEERKITNNI